MATSSGGFIVQLMPNTSEEVIYKLEEKLKLIPTVSEMLSSGYTVEDMIYNIAEDVEILEKIPLNFRCNCSKERFARGILSLGAIEIKEMIDEAVANTSDELLEKYINEEPFTKEEISWALRKGVMERTLIPVLCGTDQIGIKIILNSIVAFFSAAGDMTNSLIVKNIDTDEEEIIGYDESLPASIFIFKTIADPFIGRTTLFKVVTGTLYSGSSLYLSLIHI